MISLKKIITLISITVLLVFSSSTVFAKSDNEPKGKGPKKNVETSETEPGDDEEEAMSPKEAARARYTVRKLNKILDETDDPEVEEAVEEIAEDQEEIEESADEAVENIDGRPAHIKFLLGPDFKNLGQLRREVVHTRNNIRKLVRLQEKAGEDDQELIEDARLEMETRMQELQSDISQGLTGFSLFGWLNRLMSGFVAPEFPVESPVPSVEPSESPGPTGSPEGTPVESPEPTEEPSPSPEL